MISPNTHGDIVYLGDGIVAFVDGVPDTCDHKEEDDLYQTASGKWIHWYTFRQWAHKPAKDRYRLIHEYQESIGDSIILGTSECRKCKRIFHPPLF